MKQLTTPEDQRIAPLWNALKELQFLSSFFSWFFMLLSRLAEPCLLLSVLYIVVEAGVPQVALATLHNVAVGIMLAAPELLLPGAFTISRQAKDKGEEARPLFAICWLFLALTLVTLLSLFVLHLSGIALSILTCCRCAAGVAYSILIRMLSYRGVTQEQLPPQQPAQTPQLVICPELVDLLREMVTAQTTVVIEEREQQKQIAGPGMKEEPGAAGAETTGAGAQDTGQPGNFERVRAYLAENPKAKIREVSEALTISMSTASKHMNKVRGK